MIDVIIPTLLRTDKEVFKYTLDQLNESSVVGKIIIIDNSQTAAFKEQYSECLTDKVDVVELNKNIFVNPSWNLGMQKVESPHYAIINDDIMAHKEAFNIADQVLAQRDNIGLVTFNTHQSVPLSDYSSMVNNLDGNYKITDKIPNNGRIGWFMAGRTCQWIPIPDELLIFFGDDFIYRTLRKRKYAPVIADFPIVHFESTTVSDSRLFKEQFMPIIRSDTQMWTHKIVKELVNGRYC